jgi:hypothetical protein
MGVKEYCKGLKKEGLPSFEEMDSEFDISEIEQGNFARKISEKIAEKIKRFRELLEEYMHADGSSVAALNEIREMDDSDKDRISSSYKELILIDRNFMQVDLENNEEGFLQFIVNTIKAWNEVKPKLIEIIGKAKDSWKNVSKIKEDLKYLG